MWYLEFRCQLMIQRIDYDDSGSARTRRKRELTAIRQRIALEDIEDIGVRHDWQHCNQRKDQCPIHSYIVSSFEAEVRINQIADGMKIVRYQEHAKCNDN